MEWQQLLGFHHVARLKSFTRAAEVTLRTQSALSQQIRALEEELECQLFERVGRRKVLITPAGEKLLRFTESMLRGQKDLMEELNQLKHDPKGPLKIAAPFTTLYHLLPETIKEYTQNFPNVELTLLDRPQGTVIQLVREGEIDFGFALQSAVPRDLKALCWKKVDTVLMVPRGHPLVHVEQVTFDRLAQYPFILPPRNIKTNCRRMLERELSDSGVNYRIVMESSNVELTSIYVEMGLGISFATIVSDLPALKERKLDFIPLDHYFPADHIAVVVRKDKTLTSYKREWVSLLTADHVGHS